jgi:uncharacterized tellurite resistance protein B-like protein
MKNELYRQIGTLFYTIAMADKTLSIDEYAKLSKALEENWQHVGEHAIKTIKNEFNALKSTNTSSEACFNQFVSYLHKNPTFFNEELKSLILKTANEIAYAFAKINKSELKYMAKLSIEFKKAEI